MAERPPFDPVRGVFAVILLILVGSLVLGVGIEAGCFYDIAALCEKGSGIKELMGDVLALIALILGVRRPPPPSS